MLDTPLATSALPMPAEARAAPRTPKPVGWAVRARRALKSEVENLNLRLIAANFAVSVLPSLGFSRVRTFIYRLAGIRIGAHSLIFGRMEFTGAPPTPGRLHIGSDTMINDHCFADLNAEIHIGNRVSIGHHVTFVTAEHEVGPASCRAGARRARPIVIDDGCWIGAHSTVLPGVHIGRSSVVAAGSLVSGNVPPNRLVGGVPARALRSLPSEP